MSNKGSIIAIGGLGGSGTRLIANFFLESGFNLGDCLNGARDNLVFTGLFKSPIYYRERSTFSNKRKISLFLDYMQSTHCSIYKRLKLIEEINKNKEYKWNFCQSIKFLFRKRTDKATVYWGWKEPNTYIF
jgi:hypothetical protein